MGEAQDPAAVNAAAADYVRQLRERLADGKQEIERQKAVLEELDAGVEPESAS
jgi:hypothetical protein